MRLFYCHHFTEEKMTFSNNAYPHVFIEKEIKLYFIRFLNFMVLIVFYIYILVFLNFLKLKFALAAILEFFLRFWRVSK